MKKYYETQSEMRERQRKQIDPKEFKEAHFLDIQVFKFICAMQAGKTYSILGKTLHCHDAKYMQRITMEYNGIRIIAKYAFGNWYTSLRSKGITKQQVAFDALVRDIEGALILDSINAKNPLHSPSIIN